MTTRVQNRESVALGIAELFLDLSALHIANAEQALTSNRYFGSKTKVTIDMNKEYLKRVEADGDILMLLDHLLTRVDFSVTINFIEIYPRTLSLALGGDGSSTDFLEDLFKNPTDMRAELVFTYPNKINKMIIIIPRAHIITDNLSLDFQKEDAMEGNMMLKACRTDNEAWTGMPLGRTIFI